MIFKTRNIKKQFDTIHDFGIENLIVSGASFTYNTSEEHLCSWPYYLRDLGGFKQVLDCSMQGAGNHHISNSLQWAIEVDEPAPSNSLVIVMWSNNYMDDYICPGSIINDYPFKFNYSNDVVTGITGGTHVTAQGNTNSKELASFGKIKTLESRAIENYLYINSLYNFLQNKGYKFLFLDYLNYSLPARLKDIDIKKYLPNITKNKLDKIITKITPLYEHALKNDLLAEDDYHPSLDGHLDWTRKVLLPKLQTIIT